MTASPGIGDVFGERLRELRQKRGLTQVHLSERSGFPQSHISELENGSRMPTLLSLVRLAVALDCKVTDLISPFNKADLPALLRK